MAWLGVALIDVLLAVLSLVAGEALAKVVLNLIQALGAVHARSTLAVVHVDLAMVAVEARVRAVALVRVDAVQAHALVQTRRRL